MSDQSKLPAKIFTRLNKDESKIAYVVVEPRETEGTPNGAHASVYSTEIVETENEESLKVMWAIYDFQLEEDGRKLIINMREAHLAYPIFPILPEDTPKFPVPEDWIEETRIQLIQYLSERYGMEVEFQS